MEWQYRENDVFWSTFYQLFSIKYKESDIKYDNTDVNDLYRPVNLKRHPPPFMDRKQSVDQFYECLNDRVQQKNGNYKCKNETHYI